MKKIFFMLLGLALIPATAFADAAVVSHLTGEPQLVRGGQTLTIKPGTQCQTGDTLITSSGCNVDLALSNLAGCRVLPSSECVITGTGNNMKVEIKKGNAILNLRKLPAGSTFQVETPTAIASVRGTQFWGRVVAENPVNPVTTFAVRRGMVDVLVKKAGKSFSLKKGDALDIPLSATAAPSVRPALASEMKALEEAPSIKTSA